MSCFPILVRGSIGISTPLPFFSLALSTDRINLSIYSSLAPPTVVLFNSVNKISILVVDNG